MLLECCDKNNDQQIDYVEFANFLNWKDKMPSGFQSKKSDNDANQNKTEEEKYEERILKESGMTLKDSSNVTMLSKQIDNAHGDYTTSSSVVNGNVLNDFTKGWFSISLFYIISFYPLVFRLYIVEYLL